MSCLKCIEIVSYLHVSVCTFRTCVPLEARAPLGAGYDFVRMCIAGSEEGIGARLVPVQVQALDLWLVELEVEVCVQAREHPAQRVLANRWRPDLKLCRKKRGHMYVVLAVLMRGGIHSASVVGTHCSSPASGSWLSCGFHYRAELWTSPSDDSPPPLGPTHCTLWSSSTSH